MNNQNQTDRLSKLSSRIDEIDGELLKLFLERMDISSAVADYKRSTGMAVLDPVREKQVLKDKTDRLFDKSKENEVYEFFSSIMSISRDRQNRELHRRNTRRIEDMLKPKAHVDDPVVAYFGTEGSYSEEAAIEYFGEDAKRFNAKNFEDAFLSLKDDKADYAVLPIENSYTGTISDVIDLLADYNYYIVGEAAIPIRHCLLGLPGASVGDIRHIYSHEQGIMQSMDFLKTLKDVEWDTYFNTARSAKMVAESGDKTKAAIASRRSARLYGLDILAEDINNSNKNTTRFIVVSKAPELDKDCDKISAAFTLPHESGELHRVLACFARGGLNLLKIESRPLPDRNFEYKFFVDYVGNLLDEDVRRITNGVIEGTSEFELLGNYKAAVK